MKCTKSELDIAWEVFRRVKSGNSTEHIRSLFVEQFLSDLQLKSSRIFVATGPKVREAIRKHRRKKK